MATRGTGGPGRTDTRSAGSRSGTPRTGGSSRPGERRTPKPGGASAPAAPGKGGTGAKGGKQGGKPAQGTAPVTALRPASSHAVNRTRRLAILATVVALLAVFVAPTLHAWLSQRSQISALRSQVAAQQRDVATLQKQQQLWTDDEYVIQQARERLKFVKPGEKSYTVIAGDPDSADSRLATAPASSDGHPWYGRLWESIGVADAPAAHP